jgi:intracellular septation protein
MKPPRGAGHRVNPGFITPVYTARRMKLFLDYLPILLFFGTFKYTETHAQWAADFATRHLGFLAGGSVGLTEAPVMLATVVVIFASLAQVLYLKLRGQKVGLMLWISLALVVILGGLTIWLKSETFIKWKPTGLHWAMALVLWGSQALFNRNLLRKMMGEQLELPDPIWRKLNTAWVLFFALLGGLNLWVAFNFSTDTWVNFKLFGTVGLMVVFVLAQGLYLSKHLPPDSAEAPSPKP